MGGPKRTDADGNRVLTRQEAEIADLHVAGLSTTEIGKRKRIGLTRTAVWKTLKRPHVAAYVQSCMDELTRQLGVLRLQGAQVGYHALHRLAQDETAPPAAQVSAARALYEAGLPKRLEVGGVDGAPMQTETRIVIVSGSAAEAELDRLADEEDG